MGTAKSLVGESPSMAPYALYNIAFALKDKDTEMEMVRKDMDMVRKDMEMNMVRKDMKMVRKDMEFV